MAFLSSQPHAWVAGALTALSVTACAAFASSSGETSPSGGAGGGWTSNGGNGGTIDYGGGGTGGTGGINGEYAYLCGPGTCDPSAQEAAASCFGREPRPPGGAGGAGGGGGSSGASGGSGGAGGGGGSSGASGGSGGAGGGGGSSGASGGSGGAGGMNVGGAGGGGGAGGSGGGAGGMNAGGAGGSGGEAPGPVECKLVVNHDALEGEPAVERACVEVGAQQPLLSPCNTAADCGAGLGCVLPADQGTGVCRAYCCGDVEACPKHTYCAPRPMAEQSGLAIPVCVDAEQCTLLEAGQCPEGLVCSVVRADGTTACIPPGAGKQGESCPCAPGFACTKLVNECRKICHTNAQASPAECDPGFQCQGNASLPNGFGLCVSTSDL